jgi:hypothetical protein
MRGSLQIKLRSEGHGRKWHCCENDNRGRDSVRVRSAPLMQIIRLFTRQFRNPWGMKATNWTSSPLTFVLSQRSI